MKYTIPSFALKHQGQDMLAIYTHSKQPLNPWRYPPSSQTVLVPG